MLYQGSPCDPKFSPVAAECTESHAAQWPTIPPRIVPKYVANAVNQKNSELTLAIVMQLFNYIMVSAEVLRGLDHPQSHRVLGNISRVVAWRGRWSNRTALYIP